MVSAIIHLFPATIHPMVVHFTIAIIYLAGLAGLAGLIFRKDKMYPRVFLILLGLAILATLAAGVAGVISESYAHITPTVARILATHKKYGEITGVIVVIGFLLQGWKWWNKGEDAKVSLPAFFFAIVAVVMVSLTGHLGGLMVYHHALGVTG